MCLGGAHKRRYGGREAAQLSQEVTKRTLGKKSTDLVARPKKMRPPPQGVSTDRPNKSQIFHRPLNPGRFFSGPEKSPFRRA